MKLFICGMYEEVEKGFLRKKRFFSNLELVQQTGTQYGLPDTG